MGELQGRRLPDVRFGEPSEGWDQWEDRQAGDYMLVQSDGYRMLYFVDPLGHVGSVRTHTITENDDGTITVEPSIAPRPDEDGWHGFLRAGVWSDA